MSRTNAEAPRLTRRQKQALRLLADGNAPNDVARELGIGLRKLSSWRRLPEFERGLAIAACELGTYCRLIQKHALAQALVTVIDTMRSKRALPRTIIQSRLAAAQLVLTTWSRRGDDPEWRDTGNAASGDEVDLLKSNKVRRALHKYLELAREAREARDSGRPDWFNPGLEKQ